MSLNYKLQISNYKRGFILIKTLLRKNFVNVQRGFTLIELLVVISIIGVVMGLSFFGLQGARESARDARRKSDLELIRSGLELYRSDCNQYPASLNDPLIGDDSVPSCTTTNVYIEDVPDDPNNPVRTYRYYSNGTVYSICASLEEGVGSVSCGGSDNCGETCNYKVENP